ncbi:MAG TPA: acetyl-CoA carboxylase carboxyltransferase subunit alpha [Candidatus Limnocylindrales bacterium]|nr:acetyl-CoA carboxylase carboxyltransferase subunit alpha [Candidatus Limnocylindrales bacterium]
MEEIGEAMGATYELSFEKKIIEIENKIAELKRLSIGEEVDFSEEIRKLEKKASVLTQEIFSKLTDWERTQVARHPNRPYFLDYISRITTDFIELHGDRHFGDDKAIVGGLAKLDGRSVVFIGHQKGRTTKENIVRNFGMPHPEGYRKALRLMKLAEKFKKPIITMIDTPGAYPGIGAEERGQAEAIAVNLLEMSKLQVPILVVIIGEGGSGGALALGVGNRVLMLENSIYSVISPEGCAAILWEDQTKAPEAAERLCLTANHLMALGVIDEIVKEPLGGAHKNHDEMASILREALKRHLKELDLFTPEELVEQRYQKFRAMGVFEEG